MSNIYSSGRINVATEDRERSTTPKSEAEALMTEAANFLYMAWGYVPESTRAECKRLEDALRDFAPQSEKGMRSFSICEDHRHADWNQPELEGTSCVLCRLFYLEAQESLLEEWQQRAQRAEEAIEEVKRPLDAQMARLNATVAQLNDENDRLKVERGELALKLAGAECFIEEQRALKNAIGPSATERSK